MEPEAVSVMPLPHLIAHSNLPIPPPPLVGSLVRSRNTTAGAPPTRPPIDTLPKCEVVETNAKIIALSPCKHIERTRGLMDRAEAACIA